MKKVTKQAFDIIADWVNEDSDNRCAIVVALQTHKVDDHKEGETSLGVAGNDNTLRDLLETAFLNTKIEQTPLPRILNSISRRRAMDCISSILKSMKEDSNRKDKDGEDEDEE